LLIGVAMLFLFGGFLFAQDKDAAVILAIGFFCCFMFSVFPFAPSIGIGWFCEVRGMPMNLSRFFLCFGTYGPRLRPCSLCMHL